MADGLSICVEVAYARPDVQRLVALRVPSGTTARQALERSGLAKVFPEIDAVNCPLGIFGSLVAGSTALAAGDRVEVYRPLAMDPREARRRAVARGLTIGGNQAGSTGTSS